MLTAIFDREISITESLTGLAFSMLGSRGIGDHA
jgi:hypothetical protein